MSDHAIHARLDRMEHLLHQHKVNQRNIERANNDLRRQQEQLLETIITLGQRVEELETKRGKAQS